MSTERVRVEEFGELNNEDYGLVNLVFLQDFSLKILSRSSLHFTSISVFIVMCMRNAKSQFQPNRELYRLSLVTRTNLSLSCVLTTWPS